MIYRIKNLFFIFISFSSYILISNDISIKLKEPEKKVYILKEPIIIEYEIRNDSDFNYIYPEDIRAKKIDSNGKETLFGIYELGRRIGWYGIEKNSYKKRNFSMDIRDNDMVAGKYIIYAIIYAAKPGQKPDYGYGGKWNETNTKVLYEDVISNSVEVEVVEPEGVDKEVYEKYLKVDEVRWKATDSQNELFWELLERYPESRYAEILLCGYDPNKNISDYKKIDIKESIKNIIFSEKNSIINEQIQRERGKEKKRYEIILKVFNLHKDSKCYLDKLFWVARRYMDYFDYNKSCEILNELLSIEAKQEIDSVIRQKAREYLEEMRINKLCK